MEPFPACGVLLDERQLIEEGSGGSRMHTLRDTATLAILILLALTLRVEMDGNPVDWNVGTTAEAASDASAVPPVPAAEPEPLHGALPAGGQILPLPLPPGLTEVGPRTFELELDGTRLMILVDTNEEVQADVEKNSTHDSCGRAVRADLSS
jgi:hypothetical protein